MLNKRILYVVFVSFVAALGGFLFGWAVSCLAMTW